MALAALCGWSVPAAAQDFAARAGSLGIEQVTRRSSLQFSANQGLLRVAYLQFRVHHAGRVVAVPDERGGGRTEFRDAWVLPGARWPAVLVRNDRWALITERDGRLQIETLPSADVPALQWLDGPAPPLQVGHVRTEPTSAEAMALRGGRWLQLDGQLLLDVETLRSHRLDPQVPAGYAAVPDGGLGVSPDGRAVALLYRGEWNTSRDALIMVVGTEAGAPQQLLPLDLTPYTRLGQVAAEPGLLARHFRWVSQPGAALPLLQPQPLAPAKAWQTRYLFGLRAPRTAAGVSLSRFELTPVRASMLEAVRVLMREACDCEFTPAPESGAWQLRIPTITATMRFDAARQTLLIEASNDENAAWAQSITRELGEKIEARLNAGGLREHLVAAPGPATPR